MNFRRMTLVLAILVGLTPSPASRLHAQVPADWDPTGLALSRDDLTRLLAEYETAATSGAYSPRLRERARADAERIRTRLEEGDFRVGDQVVVELENSLSASLGQAGGNWSDTLLVEPGPSLAVPDMEPIALAGVLRSELRGYLTEAFSRYIREPRLRASALIRLSIQGAVGRPGFYVIDSNALLGDVIMAAGGPSQNAEMEEIEILRGTETLLEGEEVNQAIAEGRTLDQLGLRAGDYLEVPLDQSGVRSVWWQVGRIGIGMLSVMLLGRRIFF